MQALPSANSQTDAMETDGWTRTGYTRFNDLVGPFWRRGAGETLELGFMADEQHVNHVDIVHGGMLMTYMDLVLGLAIAEATGSTHAVTIQLNMSFVGAGRRGDLLLGHGRVSRTSRTVLFARGEITGPGGLVMTGEGIWKALTPNATTVAAGSLV